jgi:uncharacterized protein YbjT (DUF2867 family)
MAERVLVTGATGAQGGAVARALRDTSVEVVALVRDAGSAPAKALAADGVTLRVGNLDDPGSVEAACAGCDVVFSVQVPGEPELRHGRNLVTAAKNAGVAHMVHTSVSGTGWRARSSVTPSASQNRYWDQKEAVETMARDAGFDTYTILKPALMMDNFVTPKSTMLFPLLAENRLVVATSEDAPVSLVAAADIGAAAAAVIADPRRYAGAEIELGGDLLTFGEIADTITKVSGHAVTAASHTVEEVVAIVGEKYRPVAITQAWYTVVGYPARREHAEPYGLPLTTFEQWANDHVDALRASTTPMA